MKVGDKVKFVKHHGGSESANVQCGLIIGNIYTVEAIDKDGTPKINGMCCTYHDEVELIEESDGMTWEKVKENFESQYPITESEAFKSDKHYNNKNGSLYLFAQHHNLNAWEFDILKRVVRCRKKGQFKEDLEKTKRVIDLYLKEFEA